jgi:dUTPase
MALLVKKISQFATLPARGSAGAAGYDLSAAYDCIVPARGKALCKTDLEMAIPTGHYGRVGARGALAQNPLDAARARCVRPSPPLTRGSLPALLAA